MMCGELEVEGGCRKNKSRDTTKRLTKATTSTGEINTCNERNLIVLDCGCVITLTIINQYLSKVDAYFLLQNANISY